MPNSRIVLFRFLCPYEEWKVMWRDLFAAAWNELTREPTSWGKKKKKEKVLHCFGSACNNAPQQEDVLGAQKTR